MSRRAEAALRREVKAGDEAAVRALVAATGVFNAEEIEIAAELVRERLERGPASGYEFLLDDRPEGLAGYSCWGRVEGTESAYYLYWIAVSPERQGQGVGGRILAATEAAIAEGGGGAVWVDTGGRDTYAPTRAFYRACGYAEAARLDQFYGPGDDKVVFVRRVAGT